MMLRDNAGIDEYLKIYPIKTRFKLNNNNGVTKNFAEFQRVYGWILNKRDITQKEQPGAEKIQKNVRPLIDLKTIRMEMPALGAEQSIIQPRKKTVVSILKKPTKEVNTGGKNTTTSTEQLVKKLKDFELPRKDGSLRNINQNTSSFLEQTNRELDIAAAQLEQIKSIIQFKPAEDFKRPKTPMHKSKKKNRHSECVKKKYLSTLSVMQQKLNTLEKKYFNRPKIAYKSVNDTFTQSSEVEMIFKKSDYDGVEIDRTLEGIMTDLDELMNANVTEKYSNYEPRDLAFNTQRDVNSLIKNESKQTDPNEYKRIYIHDSSHGIINEIASVNYDSFMNTKNYSSMEKANSPAMTKKRSSIYAYQNEVPEKESAGKVHSPKNCSPTSRMNYDDQPRETRTLPRKNLSFKKCDSKSLGKDPFSAVIDASESQLKKYRSMKQDIIDVETFCEKICNLAKDEDQQDTPCNTPVENEGRLFDGSQLQSSVMKSCFLMKEFDTQPKINYFCENDIFSRNGKKFANISENCSETSVKSLKKLIRNLNSALDNSIYRAIETE